MKSVRKGFTLIELLIVIAVLGILAVAVLSAINPIEQINRSKDTGSRSDSEQLVSAIERYYATSGWYPWMEDANSENESVDPLVEIISETQAFGVDGELVLQKLSSGGNSELKQSFVTRVVGGNTHLWLYNRGTAGDSTYVCFLPASGAFQAEAFRRCDATTPDDFPGLVCPAVGCTDESETTSTTCMVCLP